MEGVDCLVERGSRDREIAKFDPSPNALRVKPGLNSVFQNIVLCQRVLDMR
jgi:hypothetical protein